MLNLFAAIIGASCVLLAFSEFAFLNEEPVVAKLRAGSPVPSGFALFELLLFYLLSGTALIAL